MTTDNNETREIEILRQQLADTRVQLEAAKRLLDQVPPDVFFGEQSPTPAAPNSELVVEAAPFAELWEMFEKEQSQRKLTNPDYEIRDFLNQYTSGIYLQNRWRELVAAAALKASDSQ